MKYPNMTWGTMEAIVNKLGGEATAKGFLRGTFEIVAKKILDMHGTTATSATTHHFVAKDKFCKDSKEVTFFEISDNFTNMFLVGDSKIEESIGEQELYYGDLTKNSVDDPIIEELGGEAKAETTLIELFDLLKKQPNGEESDLLINGYANIFYIKDSEGVLRAVYVLWRDGGWYVGAISGRYPSDWPAGSRVFSRNS